MNYLIIYFVSKGIFVENPRQRNKRDENDREKGGRITV